VELHRIGLYGQGYTLHSEQLIHSPRSVDIHIGVQNNRHWIFNCATSWMCAIANGENMKLK
jgi:hypothetical protein